MPGALPASWQVQVKRRVQAGISFSARYMQLQSAFGSVCCRSSPARRHKALRGNSVGSRLPFKALRFQIGWL